MTIKEKLYHRALERELEEKYDKNEYGKHCLACGDYYDPVVEKIFHYRRCPTAQLERILAI